jgi:predicted PurR-regulated permease PerM
MYFAKAVFLPIVTAVVLALFFRPSIRWARRRHLPTEVSAAFIVLGIIAVLTVSAGYLLAPAREWIDNAPRHVRVAGDRLHGLRKQVEQFNEATAKVELIAAGKSPASTVKAAVPSALPDPGVKESTETEDTASSVPEKLIPAAEKVRNDPVPVEMRQPRLVTGMAFLSTTGSVLGELFVALVLAYFFMASGDMLINNVLRVLPSMREKRNVVELVYSVEKGISSYMATVACINAGLGVAIGLAMWMLGMPNPALWGAMAAVFNFLPYLGALVGICIVFLVALLTFDSLPYACLIPATYFGITVIEGNFITPHLIGRSLRLNPIMVFLSLTFGGWLWGMGGAILAVPIMAMLKVGFDQFEKTRAIGTLLGGSESS